MFGNIQIGGAAAASPRYICTQLNPMCKILFNKYDEAIYKHQQEDNMKIEPEYYAPIIPMILVNGTDGIGTGFSTEVQSYNPRDIVNNIRRTIKNKECREMMPWYKHFKGVVEKVSDHKYDIRGNYQIIDDNTIRVTELPVGIWAETFKENCIKLCEPIVDPVKKDAKSAKSAKSVKSTKSDKSEKSDKELPILRDYKSAIYDVSSEFTLLFNPGMMKKLIDSGSFESQLRLSRRVNTGNMHLFTEEGKIRKFSSPEQIIGYYSKVRLELYTKRKEHLLAYWRNELELLKWTRKFILNVLDKKIIIERQRKVDIHARLEELKFPKLSSNDAQPSYNYTDLSIYCLTQDEIDRINTDYASKTADIDTLESKSNVDLWEEELDEFMVAYDKWEQQCRAVYDELTVQKKKTAAPKVRASKVSK
jgi:DNA topoisomerase-2